MLLLSFGQLNAQNTKGDRPAAPNKKETRQTRFKIKSKQGDKAKTKDIAGRRLRTKNKSSANKANASYPQPRTAIRSPRQGRDRAGTPIRPIVSSSPRDREGRSATGKPAKRVEVRSVSAAASKRNVYPQKQVRSVSAQSSRRNVYSQRSNPYVNNASRKPRDPQGTSGARPKRRVQVRSVTARSSQQNIYSNRGNRYVNNPSRKPRDTQRASTRPVSGRNVQGSSSRPISSKRISATPKSSSRAFIRHKALNPFVGFFSVKKKEGDVSGKDLAGRPLRMRNFQSPAQAIIKPTIDPKTKKPIGDRAYKGPTGSYKSATRTKPKAWVGDLSGRKIRGRNFESKKGGSNAPIYAPRLAKPKVGDHPKNKSIGGFRSYSSKYVGKVGMPIPVKTPGKKAEKTARYQSRLNGKRVISGGGSVSGKKWNNNGQPIAPRQPGIGIRGINYAGNLKAGKPLKGGGSISGKTWNNNGQPITPRQPGIGIRNINYAGNLKASKPLKGGGSISGKTWNNNGQPINPRQPGIGIKNINYAGNLKASKPQKGGGSISGKLWNNNGQPINPRQPGIGIKNVNYAGNIPATKPLKGGGSVSGQINSNKPIAKRVPSDASIQAGTYKGTRGVGKVMVDQGESFTGFKKRGKYLKTPYQHASALMKKENKSAYLDNGIPIRMRQPGWARNKNAHENALLKKDPGGNVFKTDGLQIAVKSPGYKQNPNANAASILKRKQSEQTYLSNGLTTKMKQPGWARNKNAHEDALLKKDPGGNVFKTDGLQIAVKSPGYKQNPNANAASILKRKQSEQTYLSNGLTTKMKQPGWARNKNAHEDALLKKDPGSNVFQTDGLQIRMKSPGYKQNPNAHDASIMKRKQSAGTFAINNLTTKMKQPGWARNKNAHEDAFLKRDPSKSVFATNGIYGKTKAYQYIRNPSSSREALKVREPGKAFAKAVNYQGNIKMQKFNFFKNPDYHPDAQFVKTNKNNVKGERDLFTNIRLFWAKNFRKNETQPDNIKEKVRKPRYDKREVGLWYD